jgi:DNA helicase-2/ATP-dependent DNA helicase PcrA
LSSHLNAGVAYLARLNASQLNAASYGIDNNDFCGPLLIIAGAGTGKTTTLAHRYAHLIINGISPDRIMLLTFTKRAAAEMSRRAEQIVTQALKSNGSTNKIAALGSWTGTFHSIANRILREYHHNLDLDPSFSVIDTDDAADILDLERHALGLQTKEKRFPQKMTCLDIYSRTVNAQRPLSEILESWFPQYQECEKELNLLFARYVGRKLELQTLDYDDLLLYWNYLLEDEQMVRIISDEFDHMMVDEYQDTNKLQANILKRLRPSGTGVTVVGDDAQSIYSFRSAEVENILEFPNLYDPPAEIIKLQENYRSTQGILDATNALMGESELAYQKELVSVRGNGEKPTIVTVEDEKDEALYIADQVLECREEGVRLQEQAVLFRNGYHAKRLEIELGRRNIPFVKYGGLKFVETAHVKDFIAILSWAENPKNKIVAFRTLQLLEGIGPKLADKALKIFADSGYHASGLSAFEPPPAAASGWEGLRKVIFDLRQPNASWNGQLEVVGDWYQPYMEHKYGSYFARSGDIEQLIEIGNSYPSRERFLTELVLDPASASGDLCNKPKIDEDFLILSTVHSAKGQEWDTVYVMHVSDGTFPNEFAAGNKVSMEEERRLLNVAMTRPKNRLILVNPLKYFVPQQSKYGDNHVYGTKSRFLTKNVMQYIDSDFYDTSPTQSKELERSNIKVDVKSRLRAAWATA